ncbi:hypothetical protein ACOSP7_020226 [Xanthoceras sorbifolium]
MEQKLNLSFSTAISSRVLFRLFILRAMISFLYISPFLACWDQHQMEAENHLFDSWMINPNTRGTFTLFLVIMLSVKIMSNPQLIDEILDEPIGSNNHSFSSSVESDLVLDSLMLRSKVWPHFKRQKINGRMKVICIYCKFSLNGGSKDGTSHLKNHLKRCGKSKLVQTDLNQPILTVNKGDSGKDVVASYVYDQNVAKKKLAHMIIMHEYPLSMIMGIYDVEKVKTTSFLEANNCIIAITTDLWTVSSQRKGYMTRWNSTCLMLTTKLKYKNVFSRLSARDRQYKNVPQEKDWDLANLDFNRTKACK